MQTEAESNLILSGIRKIKPEMRIAFFSALIFGIASHGTMLLNKISFNDDIIYLFKPGSTITFGRWALHLLAWLETLFYGNVNASLPLFNGLLSIFCIGAVSAMLVNLLKIRNRVYCALLGGLMVSFPFVTALFAYMFTSHYYMIGLVMMVFSAWLICRERRWWAVALAILLGSASIGIYQAFLSFLAAMILLYDIDFLTKEEGSASSLLRKLVFQALCILAIFAVYFAVNQFFLRKFDVELTEYMGIGQMGEVSISDYLSRCLKAYQEFVFPARGGLQDMYPGTLHDIHLVLIIAEGLLAVQQVIITGRKNRGKAVLLAVLFALVPLACNLIYVMSEIVHGVMIYGNVMHFVLLLWLLDRVEFRKEKLRQGVAVCASLVMFMVCVMFGRFAHQCYLKVTLNQQEAISYCTSMITRIQSQEGYRPEMEVAVIGKGKFSDPTFYHAEELDFISLIPYHMSSLDHFYISFEEIMQLYCGFSPSWYEGDGIRSLPEVEAMPAYPADGSVRIVQDVVVVKLY